MRLALAGALTLAALAAGSTPAHADVPPTPPPRPACQTRDEAGVCVVQVQVPGSGGGGAPAPGGGRSATEANSGGGSGDSTATNVLTIDGQQCTYSGLQDPQPPKTDPIWQGRTSGAIYGCQVGPRSGRPGLFLAGYVIPFWAATAPAAPPPPDPRVLAQRAIASMALKAVNIGIVPEDQPGRVGVIGMPTWMWVNGPSATTMGPITRSASAGGYTVTATATVKRVVWSMGDGNTVTCTGPGTPYADSYGKKSSPTCGHTYTRQGRYIVTATSYWDVDWSGIGQTGVIPLDFSRSTTITMGEVQVLTQ